MIVIGSRGSQLALWQARHISALLAELGTETRIEVIKTTGDKITDVPLAQVGGKGLFTKEIEEALLEGKIDLAVHSLKDMPADLPDGLTLAGIPEREDPRDALVGRTLSELKPGHKVGTSSLRRVAQIHALGIGVATEMLRGNLDTRLRKLDEGKYDAIILAAAGLRRLGWEGRIRECIPVETMCPAVGQGALAIETRADDGQAHRLARQLEHAETRIAVTAERALLAVLGGGCQVPIGAYARVDGPSVHLRAIVASPDGARVVQDDIVGSASDAGRIGEQLARRLLDRGAREILAGVYSSPGAQRLPLFGKRIVVTRDRSQAMELAEPLKALGAEPILLPVIEIRAASGPSPLGRAPLDQAITQLDAYDWLIFTSVNGVRYFAEALDRSSADLRSLRAKLCAIGPATRAALEELHLKVDRMPKEYVAESLVEAFAGDDLHGQRILLPRAAVARDLVPAELTKRGATVDVVEAYRTVAPEDTAARAHEVFKRKPDWITFTSSSTVTNFVTAAGRELLDGVRIASIGPITSATLREHGLKIDVEADPHTIGGLVSAITRAAETQR